MGLRDLLCLPRGYRRKKSKARSEIGPAENPNNVDLVALRPTGSAPDLRIGDSNLPAPGPSMSHDLESHSMRTVSSRVKNI
jgi:hypothetical protein